MKRRKRRAPMPTICGCTGLRLSGSIPLRPRWELIKVEGRLANYEDHH